MIYQDLLDAGALERYAADLNARARRCGARGELAAEDLRDCILSSGGRCQWCGAGLVRHEFELDHVVSLKGGGANSCANLALACPDCNRRKGQKHPARFAAEICQSSGKRTSLVAQILERFALQPREQLALFGAEPGINDRRDMLDHEAQPHYRW